MGLVPLDASASPRYCNRRQGQRAADSAYDRHNASVQL